ncbi:hypothetical protein [Leifsonia poae]|uniref:hypothetical protein n=1 Tax=Leifsonia poae TaxID=110933 RepID=UPI003D67BC43
MNNGEWFDRAVLAYAAGIDDEDAVEQVRSGFNHAEYAAWRRSKLSPIDVHVRVGTDEEKDEHFAILSELGLEGTSEDSYQHAVEALAAEVHEWAAEIERDARQAALTDAVSALFAEVSALSVDQITSWLVVRASFDSGSLTFRLAEFVETDGSTKDRVVPYAEGEPPAEVELTNDDGDRVAYKGSFRGGKAVYSRADDYL